VGKQPVVTRTRVGRRDEVTSVARSTGERATDERATDERARTARADGPVIDLRAEGDRRDDGERVAALARCDIEASPFVVDWAPPAS
jgi:hypothetical protein